MINLNSVLIEGTVNDHLDYFTNDKGIDECHFPLRSTGRAFHVPTGKKQEEISAAYDSKPANFPIVCHGRLASVCNEYLKKGRGVRVVGFLATDAADSIYIEAEHIEFKPQSYKGPEPEAMENE